jgi:glycosyltransferase involved in cell wall biosynthesis
MMRNLAMLAPGGIKASETFIEAQRNNINARVKFYHKGMPPMMLDNKLLLHQNSVRIFQIELLRRLGLTPLTSVVEVPICASFLHEKIDGVFAQYGPTGVGILPVCKMLKLPLIVHFHGVDASKHDVLETYKQGYQEMFQYANYIIVVSKAMKRRILDLGASPEKVIYNPCGPNEEYFNIQLKRKTEKIFVGAGRFVDKKAPHCTILAFSKLLQYHPDAKLVLAGTGELWDVCRDLVQYLNLKDKVILPGVFAREQLKRLFAEAIGFVQHSVTPSSGDMEGTPVAVLEASAAGLPVIATRHAGIPDVIIENETGLLVDEYDIDGMAENMKRILDNPGYAQEMGRAGRENIKLHFSMERHIDTLNQLVSNMFK